MNLKEAFKTQNKLGRITSEVAFILSNDSNILITECTHYRSKVDPEAQDETVVTGSSFMYPEKITELAGFYMQLLAEKERLTYAIRKAKSTMPIDIDDEVALNKQRQETIRILARLNEIRGSDETSRTGFGYRFNADGNQVQYRCDMRKLTKLNFDRKVTRKYEHGLRRRCEETSTQIDRLTVNTEVDFTPTFDFEGTLLDMFEEYLEQLG